MVIVPKAPPFFTKYGFTVDIEEIALLSLFELIETSDNTSVKKRFWTRHTAQGKRHVRSVFLCFHLLLALQEREQVDEFLFVGIAGDARAAAREG